MKNKLFGFLTLVVLTACSDTDYVSPESKLYASSYKINQESVRQHIKILASNEYGGRLIGTKGEKLTINYIKSAFSGIGLKPANGNSYYQNVPLINVETIGTPVITFSNKSNDINFEHGKNIVVFTSKNREQVSLKNRDLVFVGYGIDAPELGWNDYKNSNVEGKVVVVLSNAPKHRKDNVSTFDDDTTKYYSRSAYKFEEAEKHGAVAAILIYENEHPWEDSVSYFSKGKVSHDDPGSKSLEAKSWINMEAADKLFSLANQKLLELKKLADTKNFKPRQLDAKTNIQFESKITNIDTKNVAGIIEGSENPDEYFIYMAHWDHLGLIESDEDDQIYNGAVDNASGVAGIIEIAKAFKSGAAPKRSILFLAVTAEEKGLLGSEYYAKNPLVPLEKTVAAINIDGLNLFGSTSDVMLIGMGNSELDQYLSQAAKIQGRTLIEDQYLEQGFFYRTDQFSLANVGIPTVWTLGGATDKTFGKMFRTAKLGWFMANHYHKASDEYHDGLDFNSAVEDLELYYATGKLLVDGNDWPNWVESTPYRIKRDKLLHNKN